MVELYSLHTFRVAEPEPLFACCAREVEGLSRHKARLAITAGLVQVAGKVLLDPQLEQVAGQQIRVDLRQGIPSAGNQKRTRAGGSEGRQARGRSFTILYQDDDVIVVDKAPGILAAPIDKDSKGHLLEMLRTYGRKQKKPYNYLGQVHRIDTPTSGCLMVALNKNAQSILGTQFSTHCAGRSYRALVHNGPQQDRDTLQMKLGRAQNGKRWIVDDRQSGKDAVTHFEVLQRFANYTDLRCRLETGRTHQLRIHLAAIGCPIVGDDVYKLSDAPRRRGRSEDADAKPVAKPIRANRLLLHAESLHFDHPKSGKRIEIEAPLPAVYKSFISS